MSEQSPEKKITIRVYEIVGGSLCISIDDGQKVYKRIAKALQAKALTIVDFENVDDMISAFLNAAIGQLYSKFTSEELRQYLKPINLKPIHRELLKAVLENAKLYFENKKQFDKIADDALSGNITKV